MHPKCSIGDVVACKKPLINDILFQWNKVYALDTIRGVLIRRVCKADDADRISLASKDEKYIAFAQESNICDRLDCRRYPFIVSQSRNNSQVGISHLN